MAHHFDCVVDTKPMAKTVDTVRKHVDGTTGAVVSMKLAVVAAEKEGADHVCRNVNRGFYSMIHSQISQKMAKLQSEVEAKMMRMVQQRKMLAGIRKRMERDYQMICARYTKTFTALNKNLKQRIIEIDRPVVDFVTTDAEKITNRPNQMVSTIPMGQSESIKVSQRISASNLKHRAIDTIKSIQRFIQASNQLTATTNAILLPEKIEESSESLLVPVAWVESNYDRSGNTVTNAYVSKMPMSDESVSRIENTVANAVREQEFHWQPATQIDAETLNQFRRLVNESGLDPRRQQTILRMCEAHPFEVLSNH